MEVDPEDSTNKLRKKKKLKRIGTTKKFNISAFQVQNMLRNLNSKAVDRTSLERQDTIKEEPGSSSSLSSQLTESEPEEVEEESVSLDCDSDERLRRFEEKEREKEKHLLKLKRGNFHKPKDKLLSYKKFRKGASKRLHFDLGGRSPMKSNSTNLKSPFNTKSMNQEAKKNRRPSNVSIQSF